MRFSMIGCAILYDRVCDSKQSGVRFSAIGGAILYDRRCLFAFHVMIPLPANCGSINAAPHSAALGAAFCHVRCAKGAAKLDNTTGSLDLKTIFKVVRIVTGIEVEAPGWEKNGNAGPLPLPSRRRIRRPN